MLACCPAAGHLLAFKTGLYDPLQALANWQPGSNPCGPEPWSGLVCKQGSVVAIRLKDMSLLGPLTADLLQVSHLEELHLQNNALTGMCWGVGPGKLAAHISAETPQSACVCMQL